MGFSDSRRDLGADHEPSASPSSATPSLRWGSLGLILLLWTAIYFAGIFTPPLLDDVDTIHAEAAREMVLRHDWVTMYTDGIRYLEKAPLMYWGVAASYKVFGVHDWSTRLPLMLGVLALLLATYVLGARAYGERGGFYSAVVLATCLGPYIFTRFQIPDIIVGLWLTLSAFFFLVSLEQEHPSRWVCWGLAATCGLSVLTKSLIGLVFPLGTIFLYLFITGNLRHILRLRLLSSTLVFLVIAAPWHILAALRNPSQGAVKGFLWFYFVNEQFLRYVNKRVPPGYDTVPILIFWGLTVLWLAPWMVFLPQGLKQIPWRWREIRAQLSSAQRASFLFVLWALVIGGFFSFSTRQEYYTIPAVPALALLIGSWLAKEAASPESESRAGRTSSWVWFDRRPRFGSWRRAAFFFPAAGTGRRSRRPAAKESAAVRSFSGTLSRPHSGSAGNVPSAIDWRGGFAFCRGGHQSVAALSAQAGIWKHNPGRDDGCPAGLRARCLCHFLARAFVSATRCRH
jgi:4-amino-4-deoxy-L-arabinose transferase-like glycosyltransferase